MQNIWWIKTKNKAKIQHYTSCLNTLVLCNKKFEGRSVCDWLKDTIRDLGISTFLLTIIRTYILMLWSHGFKTSVSLKASHPFGRKRQKAESILLSGSEALRFLLNGKALLLHFHWHLIYENCIKRLPVTAMVIGKWNIFSWAHYCHRQNQLLVTKKSTWILSKDVIIPTTFICPNIWRTHENQ